MSISMKELNPNGYPTTKVQDDNLSRLFYALNTIRNAYGKPMIVTSGLRTVEDQTRIYATKMGAGGKPMRVPMGSAHLQGAAADIWDRDGDLWRWTMDHLDLMKQLGVYMEDKSRTLTWVHYQCIPPKSGNRIFLP